uniref:RNase H type-1 domain-containing protein n=1 Tax=Cannabis sativa TaxID=3483 RepID=A0A803Q9T5_CANSA
MDGWRVKLLSQAARTVLIKNVISTIPIYTMFASLLLMKITNALDALVNGFGGQGVWMKADFYLCLIGILFASLKAVKYCHELSFWRCPLPRHASPVTRGIWKTHEFISENNGWMIGRYSSVEAWFCNWICVDESILGPPYLNPGIASGLEVGDLLDNDGTTWNNSQSLSLFCPNAAKTIMSCNIAEIHGNNTLVWMSNSNGLFLLKAAYHDMHKETFKRMKFVQLFGNQLVIVFFMAPLRVIMLPISSVIALLLNLFGSRAIGVFVSMRSLCTLEQREGIGAIGVVLRDGFGGIQALFAAKISYLFVIHGELMAAFKGLEEVDLFSDCQCLVSTFKSSSNHQ